MCPNNHPISDSQLILWFKSKDRSNFISITFIFSLPITVLKQFGVFKFYNSTIWYNIRFCNSYIQLVWCQLALKCIDSHAGIIEWEWVCNIATNLILAFNIQRNVDDEGCHCEFSLCNFIRWSASLFFKKIKWHRSESKPISAIRIPFYCNTRVSGGCSG